MKQVFKKGTKIQIVHADSDNWYKIGEIYTVHSYLEHEDAYVVEELYEVYKDSAWIDAEDVIQFVDWDNAPEGATHYNSVDCIYPWLKQTEDSYYFFDEKWTEYDFDSLEFAYQFKNAIKCPVVEKKEMQGIDWSKAPEGYDYWIVPEEGSQFPPDFHKLIGDRYYDINGEYYEEYYCDDVTVYKRPEEKEQEMSNEWKYGLPPVGIEFEYSFGNGYWFKATSTYVVGDSGVVALCETMESVVEQYLDNEECEFRPIKSKEQQEKEEAIAEMVKVAYPGDSWESQFRAAALCVRLYDAGWRKVE